MTEAVSRRRTDAERLAMVKTFCPNFGEVPLLPMRAAPAPLSAEEEAERDKRLHPTAMGVRAVGMGIDASDLSWSRRHPVLTRAANWLATVILLALVALALIGRH